ncbi:MAG TPA: hypothetical protein VFD58_28430 [Blastocatellia bacterium]|nr:hypothetical protein [Blastocatellia bacterium]
MVCQSLIRSTLALALLAALSLTAPAQKGTGTGKTLEKKGQPAEKAKLEPAERKSQPAGRVNLIIQEVKKEDASARPASGGGRLIPVRFTWLCGSTGSARLVELEARLITFNTDGKSTTVTKKLSDWTVNKQIESLIELPMADGVFARNFTLTLKGKFGEGATEQAVSTVKQGSFPLPPDAAKK